MSVTEAVIGPRVQSVSLTAGKSACAVGSGVGKRLFAVHPGMASELSDIVFEADVGVGRVKGGSVGRGVLVGAGGCAATAVSTGSGTLPIPGTTGCDSEEEDLPDAQAANNSPSSKIKYATFRMKITWLRKLAN